MKEGLEVCDNIFNLISELRKELKSCYKQIDLLTERLEKVNYEEASEYKRQNILLQKEVNNLRRKIEEHIDLKAKIGQTVYCIARYTRLWRNGRRKKDERRKTPTLILNHMPITTYEIMCEEVNFLEIVERPFVMSYDKYIGISIFLTYEEAQNMINELKAQYTAS